MTEPVSANPIAAGLAAIFSPAELLLDEASRWTYGYDNSKQHGLPDAVVLPRDGAQLQALVRWAAANRVPLTARGRGSATTGAAVPVNGGVVVSFERMNQILEVSIEDRLAVVQPGVLNGDLQQALAPHGFFWPPDPTSAAYSTVGGNLACNAGGPRTVKYGASRDNVLGLTVVTGDGELLRSGSRTTKGSVGYDLTRLLVGAEGTLGLIVDATLKLIPLPRRRRPLRALYADVSSAALAVSRLMAQPTTPSALEFMDSAALALVRQDPNVRLPEQGAALLLLEVDGDEDDLDRAQRAVEAAACGPGLVEFAAATDEEEASRLWAARKALSPCLRAVAPNKVNEDVVVPVSKIPALVDGLARLSERFGVRIVNFGHAGNGNLHVNLLYDHADPDQRAAVAACLPEVFALVFELGGTLSGEHGIGTAKRAFMRQALSAQTLAMMEGVKQVFDPAGIFNPGKVLPDG
ncbi:MAG: FAD-binding protein [Xanthomonadales bacterium]|nr:FAD-binding protein [Xanthomonadales bacterium]